MPELHDDILHLFDGEYLVDNTGAKISGEIFLRTQEFDNLGLVQLQPTSSKTKFYEVTAKTAEDLIPLVKKD